jgi:hypothetical protein
MSFRCKVFVALLLAAIAVGPAVSLPTLSAHAPTLTADSPAQPHAPGLPELAPAPLGFAMAIKVKDVGSIAAKFKTRAQAAQGDYGTGVAGAAADWEAKSAASEDLYKQAVTDAANKGRYGHGIRGAGAKYQKNATTVGPQRYAQGVANAQDAYAQGMAPVLQTIAGLNLPPRQPKGMNGERSNIVATALRRLKVGA